jgi:hypothetical protein
MVVAVTALVVALCGSAIAGAPAKLSKLIDGSDIKKRSQPANRIKKEGLTKKQIDEAALGTVPRVQHATTATSATNATTADSATSATNANTVGGASVADLTVRCRPNTTLIAAGCVETGAARTADSWTFAPLACGASRALPTVQQLLALHAAQPAITGVEWSGEIFVGGFALTVDMTSGAIGSSALAGPLPFRCVAQPTNN